jgi:hypothetical protein
MQNVSDHSYYANHAYSCRPIMSCNHVTGATEEVAAAYRKIQHTPEFLSLYLTKCKHCLCLGHM